MAIELSQLRRVYWDRDRREEDCSALALVCQESVVEPAFLLWFGKYAYDYLHYRRLVVFGPMVTFEVLWSLYDQNPSLGLSYTDVFSPFFVWCAFWVIGGMAFSYVVYQDSERRRREMVAAPAEVAAVDVVIDPVDAI